MNKIYFLLLLLIFTHYGFSQAQKGTLFNDGKIKLTYEIAPEKETKKKVSYALTITLENLSSKKVYYPVSGKADDKRRYVFTGTLDERKLARVRIENSTSWLFKDFYLEGKRSGYVTKNSEILYVLAPNEKKIKTYRGKIKIGIVPSVNGVLFKELSELSKYDLTLTPKLIEGVYSSLCGEEKPLDLRAMYSSKLGDYLQEYKGNLRYSIWLPNLSGGFYKEDNPAVFMVVDENKRQFTIHSNGNTCIWVNAKNL